MPADNNAGHSPSRARGEEGTAAGDGGREGSKTIRAVIGACEAGLRIDQALAGLCPEQTRSSIQRLIGEGLVTVEGKPVKPGQRAEEGLEVNLFIPPARSPKAGPEDIPLDILYEDDDLVVVNKPAGLVSHPGPGNPEGTLVNALLHHCRDLSGIGGVMRPGIVHRLDKETSGVMVAAKNDRAHRKLSEQFKDHRVKKTYLALVWDNIPGDEGVIDVPIGRDRRDRKKISPRTGKPRDAVTRYTVKKRFGTFTLVELQPVTGRTHQIRVHLAHIKHPVVGDPLYGGRDRGAGLPRHWRQAFAGVKRTLLHAHRLVFEHPADGRVMDLTAQLPRDMLPFVEEGAGNE